MEKFLVENPHLRQQRQENKRKGPNFNPAAHFSTAQALYTNADHRLSPGKLVVDCGATHHMFHLKEAFPSLSKDTTLSVTTEDFSSNVVRCDYETDDNITINQQYYVCSYEI
ncbi:hypothetical protein O181_008787 [Austropuccinia psidii MF-1]|uniref:Uncharacterized protein n=1 Tax=Austropuccinia psidii MF-1 TaxID=1389203 RepID=A0A9Q3BPH0_9BASI|nr:hypothetical protein [Austropuccinia psidii MF-1]